MHCNMALTVTAFSLNQIKNPVPVEGILGRKPAILKEEKYHAMVTVAPSPLPPIHWEEQPPDLLL